jgi:thymidylate synthase (FAD)
MERCSRCGKGFTIDIEFGGRSWNYCGRCKSINTLDRGFVSLIEFAGGDSMVVRAARISYGKELKGDEQDKRLIRYMLKHNHGTPFEHSLFIFHVKAPIFVARQWFRHRIGSFNEISGRYVEYQEEFYIPKKFRVPHPENKQASIEGYIENEENLIKEYEDFIKRSYDFYKRLIHSFAPCPLHTILLVCQSKISYEFLEPEAARRCSMGNKAICRKNFFLLLSNDAMDILCICRIWA